MQPYLGNLSFVIVKDITKDGAFDEAVKGVDYVIHLASPLAKPSDDPEAEIVGPAVQGTLSILRSAMKESKVKKVVITASVASVMPPEAYAPGYEGIVTTDKQVPDMKGPYPNFFVAYAASKVRAYNATLDFIEKEKPAFPVINILPTFVVGRNELATTPDTVNAGSNRLALINVLGGNDPAGRVCNTVHVDDVAEIHVKALQSSVEGNQNFLATSSDSQNVAWDDALEIVKKHFPAEVQSGLLPCTGSVKSIGRRVDTTPAEKTFGIKWKSFEDQIVELVSWYVQAAKAEK